MKRKSYPTDLTDTEWDILEPLIPEAGAGGRPRSVDMREIINAIFYVLRGAIPWRMLPHDLPRCKTVYHYFRVWRIEGVWEDMNEALRERVRLTQGRCSTPSAGAIETRSLPRRAKGGLRSYDGGKKVNGGKRHILVDTEGLLLKVKAHEAGMSDSAGAKMVV